jgi:hypothetical protein
MAGFQVTTEVIVLYGPVVRQNSTPSSRGLYPGMAASRTEGCAIARMSWQRNGIQRLIHTAF